MSNSRLHDEADAGLERITKLEKLLAESPVNSLQRRRLSDVIRVEAAVYCKSLDDAQAASQLDRKSVPH